MKLVQIFALNSSLNEIISKWTVTECKKPHFYCLEYYAIEIISFRMKNGNKTSVSKIHNHFNGYYSHLRDNLAFSHKPWNSYRLRQKHVQLKRFYRMPNLEFYVQFREYSSTVKTFVQKSHMFVQSSEFLWKFWYFFSLKLQ